MQKNTSVTIGEHFESVVASKIKEGRFGSVSEVVRAGKLDMEDIKRKARQKASVTYHDD